MHHFDILTENGYQTCVCEINYRKGTLIEGYWLDEDDITTVWGLYNYINETMFSRTRSVFAAVERDTELVNQIITVNAA